MRYAMTVTETLSRTVFLDAESAGEAGALFGRMYRDGEIVLDADDFVEASFSDLKPYYGMLDDAELAVAIANWAVRNACENTSTGNWLIYADEMEEALLGLERHRMVESMPALLAELRTRSEVLEARWDGECLDLDMALAYCPMYGWMDGDESVFGCSYDEWLKTDVLPVTDKPVG